MARVIGYLFNEEVYNQECLQSEVDEHILNAYYSFGNINECGKISVLVIDDDGFKWNPDDEWAEDNNCGEWDEVESRLDYLTGK